MTAKVVKYILMGKKLQWCISVMDTPLIIFFLRKSGKHGKN